MNNFFKTIALFFFYLLVVSCSKSDGAYVEPLRDYTTQRNTDMENIVNYMKSHYMTVVNNPGSSDDLSVTFTKIPTGGTQTSIWDQTDYPRRERVVTLKQGEEDITYTIYYIPLRGEVDRTTASAEDLAKTPCNVDKVLTAYRGEYIKTDTDGSLVSAQFEESIYPEDFFDLDGVIKGWSEIFPNFRAGSAVGNPDGTITYSDFGAGIMFIPSGLAYYAGTGSGAFSPYSPLIFNFKLYKVIRNDQDGDGIPSYLEDLNNDGYVKTMETGVTNPDNTDEVAVLMDNGEYTVTDEVPDYKDVDDDGDGVLTKNEIKNHDTGVTYPFADIPTCGGTGNGKKRYLDPKCN